MKLLAKGICASTGKACGNVRILKNVADINKVLPNDIIIVSESSPLWSLALMQASGIASEFGGIISHISIVAREMGIPCIVSVKNITNILKDDMRILLNADEGSIYEIIY